MLIKLISAIMFSEVIYGIVWYSQRAGENLFVTLQTFQDFRPVDCMLRQKIQLCLYPAAVITVFVLN